MAVNKNLVSMFVLSVLLLAAPAVIQASEARAEPISDTVISGQVTLLDGKTIRFKVLEGGMATIQNTTLDVYLGFVPVVSEDGVSVKVYEIEEVTPKHEALRYLETLDLRAGFKSEPPHEKVIDFQIDDVSPPNRQLKKPGGEESSVTSKPSRGPSSPAAWRAGSTR